MNMDSAVAAAGAVAVAGGGCTEERPEERPGERVEADAAAEAGTAAAGTAGV